MNPFLEKLKATNPRIQVGVAKAKPPKDTLETARAKCIELVRANEDWFLNRVQPAPNLIYTKGGSYYSVGLKLGNTWLRGWCEGKHDTYEYVSQEDMTAMFDSLIWSLENNECDAAIEVVRKANAAKRKSH